MCAAFCYYIAKSSAHILSISLVIFCLFEQCLFGRLGVFDGSGLLHSAYTFLSPVVSCSPASFTRVREQSFIRTICSSSSSKPSYLVKRQFLCDMHSLMSVGFLMYLFMNDILHECLFAVVVIYTLLLP